jgi:hypothetical protein
MSSIQRGRRRSTMALTISGAMKPSESSIDAAQAERCSRAPISYDERHFDDLHAVVSVEPTNPQDI